MASAKSNGKSKQITREDYAQAKAKMLRMVKAGEITREQMQERLDGMKKAMGDSADRGASDPDKRAKRARYQEAADKMAEMVKAGEITREQMQQRLDRMKKGMSGNDREEVSDDCMALRRRLGEAVRNGAMTREEAGKIWEEEGC
jgi:polyhydroxyalkanoate synthesis regulator phasin